MIRHRDAERTLRHGMGLATVGLRARPVQQVSITAREVIVCAAGISAMKLHGRIIASACLWPPSPPHSPTPAISPPVTQLFRQVTRRRASVSNRARRCAVREQGRPAVRTNTPLFRGPVKPFVFLFRRRPHFLVKISDGPGKGFRRRLILRRQTAFFCPRSHFRSQAFKG